MPARAEQLRGEVREFLEEERAAGRLRDACDVWLAGHDREFSRRLGARGWLGMTWPREYGGAERSGLERYVVTEELLAAAAPVASHWVADRQSGPLLLRHGSEEQRRHFLPPIARGECSFVIGMSEPGAGSDLAAVRTHAVRRGPEWILNGTKIWTSNAHLADFAIVLCRTAPPGGDRHADLSQLIVDLRGPGVEIRPILGMTGEHHFNELVFVDAPVPAELLIGGEGDGWSQVTSELAYERSGPERFLSTFPLLVALVRELGAEAGESGTVAIGRLVAHLCTLRRLSLGVAARLEAGDDPAVEAALVKDIGTRFEREVVELARLNAPAVLSLSSPDRYGAMLAGAVLSVPGFTLRGGTTEILRGIVARALGVR
ncbi:MAG: acyl-CoA dehydrogenase family protein [Solirubrobacterales bacterium]